MAKDDPMLHVRLPGSLIRDIDYLSVDWNTYRSGVVERLLTWAIREYKSGRGITDADVIGDGEREKVSAQA